MKRNEDSLRDICDNIRHTNICLVGVLEGEGRKGEQNIFEDILVKNFPNLGKENIQVQESQRVPNRINPKRTTPRHIIVKIVKKIKREQKQQGKNSKLQ